MVFITHLSSLKNEVMDRRYMQTKSAFSALFSVFMKGCRCGLVRFSQFDEALAAEALVGVLHCQMSTSSGREFHACTLALNGILVLANKRSTTARTRFMFHS